MFKNSYTYNDIGIVPTKLSTVKSRDEVDTSIKFLEQSLSLPIILAPMKRVVGWKMTQAIHSLGGAVILPRSEIEYDLQAFNAAPYGTIQSIPARSGMEWLDAFDYTELTTVCIDVANGFNTYVEELVNHIHNRYKEMKIIAGNVASLEGFQFLSDLKVDAVRVGVGSGAGCFIANTLIRTNNGIKPIQYIKKGDFVLSHTGTFREVINLHQEETSKLLNINGTISTPSHKYLVINKIDKELVNEENLHKFGYWIEAERLDKEQHLLIKKDV